MNWEFILKYLPMYEKAAWLTLRIGLLGIVFAIIVGFVCSTIQYYKVPVLRQIVAVYIELSRNTPLLVQLFFIYYKRENSRYTWNNSRIYTSANARR
ncbi:MAG: hypothetical protein EGP79_11795 [Roseburia intestinalis]|nr:hypothetical protein [Roseburia intestinalis]